MAMATRQSTPAESPAKTDRRQPRQARSEHTVQLIFEATAQVLRDEGETALTTNRIAERAGLSIGTLYQYFDCKEAIVLAILSRTREQVIAQLDKVMLDVQPGQTDPREVVRTYVRIYIQAFGIGKKNERDLVRLAWRFDRHDAMVLSLRQASERLAMHLQRLNHPLVRAPTPAMAFVLTRGLAGIVRSASLEESPLLGTTALEDEVVNALWGVMSHPQSQ
jgi:AcrR family transcriptional regulator